MGKKGAKLSPQASAMAEQIVETLAPIGEVSSRKMFGGYGIFENGAMFGLINSEGDFYLKADDSNRAQFEAAGSSQHGKMPYFAVPAEVRDDEATLHQWARTSVSIAHANKKK